MFWKKAYYIYILGKCKTKFHPEEETGTKISGCPEINNATNVTYAECMDLACANDTNVMEYNATTKDCHVKRCQKYNYTDWGKTDGTGYKVYINTGNETVTYSNNIKLNVLK